MILTIILVTTIAQWLVFAAISAFSRTPMPKKGLRTCERSLLVSTTALLVVWLVAFDARTLIASPDTPVAEASAAATSRAVGSCASITLGMAWYEVERKLGKPDEVRADEENRGPGAQTWIYRANRCAIHMFGHKVEAID